MSMPASHSVTLTVSELNVANLTLSVISALNTTGLNQIAAIAISVAQANALIYDGTNDSSAVAMSVTDNAGKSLTMTSGTESLTQTASAVDTLQASTHVADAVSLLGNYGSVVLQYFSPSGSQADSLTLQAVDFSYLTAGMSESAEASAVLSHATGATNAMIADSFGNSVSLLGVSAATLAANPGALYFV